jgi:PPE-repeat protein
MNLVDFGALPPEVNSGRMYAGAGSGPMVAAAAAWDGLAAELSSAATSYRSAVSELTDGSWLGPASASMAAAAAPYAAWMTTTAAQAQQSASQAWSAVAAYETAFAGTVAPPVIAANRALLASLVATNIVGQNTPVIAATEAQYGEMWAQDAAVMYGYASSSAAAATLTTFSAPPQTTNPAGESAQSAAVAQSASTSAATGGVQQVLSSVPAALQQLASGGPEQSLLDIFDGAPVQTFETIIDETLGYQSLFGGVAYTGTGAVFLISPAISTVIGHGVAGLAAPAAAAASAVGTDGAAGSALVGSYGSGMTSGSAGLGGAGVSGGLGQAASVGKLSVPQSWATASPAIRLAAAALPTAGLDGLPAAAAAGPGGWVGGMPPMGGMVNAPKYGEGVRSGSRLQVLPHTGAEPAARDATLDRWMQPNPNAPARGDALSEREELIRLRTAIAGLAKECDVLESSATLLIQKAMQR